MGDCQNYGPFLGPYYNTGPNTGPNLVEALMQKLLTLAGYNPGTDRMLACGIKIKSGLRV